MQRIIPCLWFSREAADAVALYASAFDDVVVTNIDYYPTENLPDFQREFAGEVLSVTFSIGGYEFLALNAARGDAINHTISFMLNFDADADPAARQKLDALWAALGEGGEVMMPLGEYPFSEHYGWLADRFGVTWQLMLTRPQGHERPFIRPTLLFGGPVQGRGGEALDHYAASFPGTPEPVRLSYQQQAGPATPGSLLFGELPILGQWTVLMDSAVDQEVTFNERLSLVVQCDDQAEIDHYWSALSAVPAAEACGWCVDRFGVSWQVVPVNLAQLLQRPGAYEKFLGMKKVEIAGL